MAGKPKRGSRQAKYAALHKLKAAVILLSITVVAISGIMANISLSAILWRSTLVVLCVMVITRIVVQLMITNEEMNSGEG